nr:nodulin homeobox [Fagopyrum tataricum]
MFTTSSSLSLSPLATQSSHARFSKMKNSREGPSSSLCQAFDMVAQVKETHGLGPQELFKLLKDSEKFSFVHKIDNGSSLQIDVEKLAKLLPLHLIAVVLSSQRDEVLLSYLLRGLRLLHSLCEIASRFPKIEQILLDDAKMSEQLLDLVFYLLIVFSDYRQDNHGAGNLLLCSTSVACSLYLLTVCISTHWNELACALVAHPKVDIFMDTSFRSVYRNVSLLRISFLSQQNECSANSSLVVEPSVIHVCLQCEASLQFLQSLCKQKPFRECVLRNKELCGKGGILQLALAILKLKTPPRFDICPAIVAAVCRMKSRVLSILVQLCEIDNSSFLDEAAGVPRSLHLAQSVAFEVIAVLKNMAGKGRIQHSSVCGNTYPTGLLQLNALRLTDVFSDDSNLRSYITAYFAEVLAIILALPYQEFLSYWCSSDLPIKEVDATLNYDPFAASGWIIDSLSPVAMTNLEYSESTFQSTNGPHAYAHQRTSLLVKIIANLHCFIPKICEEQERNFFLHKFLESLQMQYPNSGTGFACIADAPIAATVSKNLRLLLGHTESLIPAYLNDEDVQLFRVFFTQMRSLVGPSDSEVTRAEEDQFGRACSPVLLGDMDPDHKSRNGNLREGMSENSDFHDMDQSYVRSGQVDEGGILPVDDGRLYSSRCNKASSRCGSAEIEKDNHNLETSGSDTSSTRGKFSYEHVRNGKTPKLCAALPGERIVEVQEEDRVENAHSDEKQPRKRKRTIMNEKQISMIEQALLEEPDLQKNAPSLIAWAERLCSHGPDVTSSQIKNWLNNRKARLARLAKDGRQVLEGEKSSLVKQGGTSGAGHPSRSPESADHNLQIPSITTKGDTEQNQGCGTSARPQVQNTHLKPGEHVLLIDDQGVQIARARVHQVKDKWDGINLEETKTCVVDIIEYFTQRYLGVVRPTPQPGGPTFDDNDVSMGRSRVLWESSRILTHRPF